MSNFDKTASSYSNNAFLQNQAAKKNIMNLKKVIRSTDSIIDLGCGSGENTSKIADLTTGKVLGIDISNEMIARANDRHKKKNLNFQHLSMEDINLNNQFDCAFSNSSIYYIKQRRECYEKIYNSLKKDGVLVLQASYRDLHSKQFMKALNCTINENTYLKDIYMEHNNPVWLYPSKQAMIDEFELCGFKCINYYSEEQDSNMSIQQAINQFETNAFPSIFNPENYNTPNKVTSMYCEQMKEGIEFFLYEQLDHNNLIKIVIPRIYLILKKI